MSDVQKVSWQQAQDFCRLFRELNHLFFSHIVAKLFVDIRCSLEGILSINFWFLSVKRTVNMRLRVLGNGDLATISSQAIQNYFVQTVAYSFDKTDQVWVGLRQTGDQNRWEWVDGSPVTGTNFWHATEDHQTDQPDCVAMEVYYGKWIRQSCQQAWGWICEIPRGTYTAGELVQEFPTPIQPNRKSPLVCVCRTNGSFF